MRTPDPLPRFVCRSCREQGSPSDLVLDLGDAPAADYFPLPSDPLPDPTHPLSMWCCPACRLAQLTEDHTDTAEPRAVEPEALRQQAEDAVATIFADGLVSRDGFQTVGEFGSPHGGSWLGLFAARGLTPLTQPADLVADTFGLMHEPDQRSALQRRLGYLMPDGVLLLQFHSLEAILAERQWNALRHGHFAYFSLTALISLLSTAGLVPVGAWEFELYGKTVLLAAARETSAPARRVCSPPESVTRILAREEQAGVGHHEVLCRLQQAADQETSTLRDTLLAAAREGQHTFGYGAASRAVALISRARLTSAELPAVADASPGKQGRTMPGSRIPIISPSDLVAAEPDRVLLLLPDLLPEVSAALPGLAGRWLLSGADCDRPEPLVAKLTERSRSR